MRHATRGRACSPWSTAQRNRTIVPKTTVRPKLRPAQVFPPPPPPPGEKKRVRRFQRHPTNPINRQQNRGSQLRGPLAGASSSKEPGRQPLWNTLWCCTTSAGVPHGSTSSDRGTAASSSPTPWEPSGSGKWLIGRSREAQQSKLARLETLPGGVLIGARVPRPVVDGVVGLIPKGGNELQLVRQDLEAGGHRVAAVTRLNNKNEPSLAVRISLEATELPAEVCLGSTPYNVHAYAAPVHRCTKFQSLSHTKQKCRARQGRCSKCGKNSHTHDKCDAATMSCVNCNGRHSAAYKGFPEMIIRQRANTIRSRTYLPYTVAMQRAREELKPRVQESDQPAAGRQAVETTVPLTIGVGPPRTYAGVAAGRTARAGGGADGCGPGSATRDLERKGQQQQSVAQRPKAGRQGGAVGSSESGPGAARATTKGGTSRAVIELLSRISEVSSVWGDGPVSPLAEEPTISAVPPTSTKSHDATSGTEAEAPSKQPES